MNGRTHSAIDALIALDRKGLRKHIAYPILIIFDDTYIGNKTWGLIDFLIGQKVFVSWFYMPRKYQKETCRLA